MDIKNDNVRFITFNCDRSLEYFLFQAVKYSDGLDDEEALRVSTTIPILHVYGKLGSFGFHMTQHSRPYCSDLSPDILKAAAASIKINARREA